LSAGTSIKFRAKRFLLDVAQQAGLYIRRYRPDLTFEGRIVSWIKANDISQVIDVGAHVGEYVASLRRLGYRGSVFCFEPRPDAFKTLCAATRSDNAVIAYEMALGAADGVASMNVAGNAVSSSLLQIMPAHVAAAPNSKTVASIDVLVRRLDSLHEEGILPRAPTLMKLDTQGYESAVLDGAMRALEFCHALQLELSTVALYDNAPLYTDLIERLNDEGYSLWCLRPGFTDYATGRMLQFDAFFTRRFTS